MNACRRVRMKPRSIPFEQVLQDEIPLAATCGSGAAAVHVEFDSTDSFAPYHKNLSALKSRLSRKDRKKQIARYDRSGQAPTEHEFRLRKMLHLLNEPIRAKFAEHRPKNCPLWLSDGRPLLWTLIRI